MFSEFSSVIEGNTFKQEGPPLPLGLFADVLSYLNWSGAGVCPAAQHQNPFPPVVLISHRPGTLAPQLTPICHQLPITDNCIAASGARQNCSAHVHVTIATCPRWIKMLLLTCPCWNLDGTFSLLCAAPSLVLTESSSSFSSMKWAPRDLYQVLIRHILARLYETMLRLRALSVTADL